MGGAKDTDPKCIALLSYAAYHHVLAGDWQKRQHIL